MKKIPMVLVALAMMVAGCSGCDTIYDDHEPTIEESERGSQWDNVGIPTPAPKCDPSQIPYPWNMSDDECEGAADYCGCIKGLQAEADENARKKHECESHLSGVDRNNGCGGEFWADKFCACVEWVRAHPYKPKHKSSHH